ncbi:MAG: UvrD-helicase domain-containing protein [Lachnospiraceae bacterium]
MRVSVWALRSLKMPDYGKNSVNLGQNDGHKARPTTEALLVLAGPGSGKTTDYPAYSYLIEKSNVDPASILVITFTKAAGKGNEAAVPAKRRQAWARPVNFGTFHEIYYHILKTSCHYQDPVILYPITKKENY